MSTSRIAVVTGAVLLGLVSPIAAQQLPPVSPESLVCAEDRLLTVEGRGAVTAPPDSLRVRVAVESQAETIERAQALTSRRTKRVIGAIESLGVRGLTIRTETIEFSPVYATPPEGGEAAAPTIVAYRARNGILVTVAGTAPAALASVAGRVVDAAQRAGATELFGIELYLEDESAARDQALTQAFEDAERRATTLATAAGLSIERVHSLEAAPQPPGVLPIALESGDVAQRLQPPVETGTLTIEAVVTVRFVFTEAAPAPGG
jgi:uncharacterized protein